jgi:putative transposase
MAVVNTGRMAEGGYKIRNKEGTHFITFAVAEWVDVFTRKEYRDILLDSFRHCQKEKGLVLYSWCIMSNHVHLIASAKDNNLSDILRDFKKYTSKLIIASIENNMQESRREWMLQIFRRCGLGNSRNSTYQFWRQDNQPKELYSPGFSVQKLEYIHNNPVEAGLVEKAEEYRYSSARDYYYGKKLGLLEIEWL